MIALLAFVLAATPQDLPVEQTKKNIQVLQGLPTSQLIPVMSFMANSLGVTCLHCHGKEYESDEKPAKATARKMIAMQRAINEQHFAGKLAVTCNSCHHGRVTPPATPDVANAAWNPRPAVKDDSIGGEEAIARLFDKPRPEKRVVRGTVERYNGRDEPKSAPFTLTLGKSIEYKTDLSHPPEAVRALALYLLAPPKPEQVKGERWTITADRIRRHRETSTPLGNLPDEVVFEDFRNGLPFRAQWSRADYRVTYTIDAIE